jgi:hypothetical protein
MSVAAIGGLFALNLVLLLAGVAGLWALRGFRTWSDLLRLLGLAYLLGLALVSSLLSFELMVGIRFGLATVLASIAVVTLGGVVAGRLAGRPHPPLRARPSPRLPGLVPAIGVALALVYLEAQFRAGRLAGLFEFDGMSFWVPKAKAIYYFGGFDPAFVRTLANPFYPPLVPTFQASGFEFMGSADVITLHLLFWFPLVAFCAAALGLLHDRVHPVILWPTVLVTVTAPEIVHRGVSPLADLVLDYFVAAATLLLALWLRDRERWQLIAAALFLGAACLTKREAPLFVACLIVAALLATWFTKRKSWPALLAVAAPGVFTTFAWRVWLSHHHIANQAPETGYVGFVHHVHRAWPSLRLTLHVLFGVTWWSMLPMLVVIAVVAAFVARPGPIAVYTGAVFALGVLACTWVTVSLPTEPLTTNDSTNPIVRLTGGLVIPVATLVPLTLEATWRRARGR